MPGSPNAAAHFRALDSLADALRTVGTAGAGAPRGVDSSLLKRTAGRASPSPHALIAPELVLHAPDVCIMAAGPLANILSSQVSHAVATLAVSTPISSEDTLSYPRHAMLSPSSRCAALVGSKLKGRSCTRSFSTRRRCVRAIGTKRHRYMLVFC